jgi:trans-aconitate methyltransferase
VIARTRAVAALEERLSLAAPARRLRLALVDRVATSYAGGKAVSVLDAGCGDGLLTLALAKRHPSWSVLGVDLRDDLLEGARVRARSRGLRNVRFARADLVEPLPELGFDLVLAIEFLSEVPDDEAAVRTMVTALEPGGMFVVHVPERSWRPVFPGSSPTWREQVRQGYTAEELDSALRRAGLYEVEVVPTFRATAAAAQEIRDRIKGSRLAVRAAAFPALAAAVRLEIWGITGGRARALLATGRRPRVATAVASADPAGPPSRA